MAGGRVWHRLQNNRHTLAHTDAGADALHLPLEVAVHSFHVFGSEITRMPFIAERFQHAGDGVVRHLDRLHVFLVDVVVANKVPRFPERGERMAEAGRFAIINSRKPSRSVEEDAKQKRSDQKKTQREKPAVRQGAVHIPIPRGEKTMKGNGSTRVAGRGRKNEGRRRRPVLLLDDYRSST